MLQSQRVCFSIPHHRAACKRYAAKRRLSSPATNTDDAKEEIRFRVSLLLGLSLEYAKQEKGVKQKTFMFFNNNYEYLELARIKTQT